MCANFFANDVSFLESRSRKNKIREHGAFRRLMAHWIVNRPRFRRRERARTMNEATIFIAALEKPTEAERDRLPGGCLCRR